MTDNAVEFSNDAPSPGVTWKPGGGRAACHASTALQPGTVIAADRPSYMSVRLSFLFLAIVVALCIAPRALAQTDPFLWPYNQPTSIAFDTATISQAWQEWKSAQVTSVNAGGNGRLRVMGGVNNASTVSEGQGYGILFASIFDDQVTLDGLWLFTSDHLNAQGLMDWHIGSPGQRLGTGAATDADEDIALGLINACVKVRRGVWPASPRSIDYCGRAAAMADAMAQYEIDRAGGSPPGGLPNNQGNELLPGDSWNPSFDFPEGIVNLSYFAPGYYRVFGRFTGMTRRSGTPSPFATTRSSTSRRASLATVRSSCRIGTSTTAIPSPYPGSRPTTLGGATMPLVSRGVWPLTGSGTAPRMRAPR